MNPRIGRMIALGAFALVVVLGEAQAQDLKTAYASMAPLDEYLMADRNAEIALARSAAPEAITRDAEILVLGRHGYDTAVKGKNGFVCVVERGWMGPINGEDAANFWNPKVRGPVCYNPPAARSILPLTYKRTEMILTGQSKAQIIDGIKAFMKQGLPPLEPGAMSYMMSKDQYLTDRGDHHWIAGGLFRGGRQDSDRGDRAVDRAVHPGDGQLRLFTGLDQRHGGRVDGRVDDPRVRAYYLDT